MFRRITNRPLACAIAGIAVFIAGTAGAAELPATGKVLPKLVVSAETDTGILRPTATVASKTPRNRRSIPQSVSVLSREQMDAQNLVTTWDALSQITGITPVSNDNTQAQYHARGGALELQFDGIPSTLPLSGYQQFDLAIYDRIEVQRGPAGLLQGAGSFSGTVNMVRKRPTSENRVSLLASAGTWSNFRGEADLSGPLNESGSLRGRFVGSLQDRDYFYSRVHDRKDIAYAVVEYDLTPRTTATAMLAYQEDKTPGFSGLPAYTDGRNLNVPRSFNPYPSWNQSVWRTRDTGLELVHRFSDDWQFTVKFNQRSQYFLFHDSYPTTGVSPTTGIIANYARREFQYDYLHGSLDAFLSGNFELFGRRHELLLGTNTSHYTSTGRGVNPNQTASLNVANVPLADPPNVPEPTFFYMTGSQSRTRQSGVYSQLRLSVARPLELIVGGRWSDYRGDSRSVAPSTPTDWTLGANTKGHFSPSGGVVWNVSSWLSAYASYADIFVVQTQKKVTGETLDPRIGRQHEVGLKAELADGALQTSVALFNIRDRNRSYADVANPGFFVPIGLAESKGVELEAVGRLMPHWQISAGYTHNTTEYLVNQTAAGQPLSYWYPKDSGKLWTSYEWSAGRFKGLVASGGFNAYSHMASGTPTATVVAREQPGYAVANLQLSYPVTTRMRATLAVGNVFDTTYYTRLGGTNTYNSFGEPRSFNLSLRWTH